MNEKKNEMKKKIRCETIRFAPLFRWVARRGGTGNTIITHGPRSDTSTFTCFTNSTPTHTTTHPPKTVRITLKNKKIDRKRVIESLTVSPSLCPCVYVNAIKTALHIAIEQNYYLLSLFIYYLHVLSEIYLIPIEIHHFFLCKWCFVRAR